MHYYTFIKKCVPSGNTDGVATYWPCNTYASNQKSAATAIKEHFPEWSRDGKLRLVDMTFLYLADDLDESHDNFDKAAKKADKLNKKSLKENKKPEGSLTSEQ